MKFSLLLFLIAYNIVGHTQKLSLKNTDIILQTTFDQAISRNVGQNELINGRYYRIFSFLKLPTNVEKNEMNSLGIRFLDYLPINKNDLKKYSSMKRVFEKRWFKMSNFILFNYFCW